MKTSGLPFCYQEKEYYLPDQMPVTHYTLRDIFPVHSHDFYEFEMVLSGFGIHQLNGVSMPICRGSLIFISPGDVHSMESQQPIELVNIHFHPSCMDREIYLSLGRLEGQTVTLQGNTLELLEAEFLGLEKLKNQEKDYCGALMKNSLERIALYFLKNLSLQPKKEQENGIQEAFGYINRHFREPISLEQAARISHLSPAYFSRRFCREVGMTFEKYVVSKRLELAKNLLTATELSVCQVCFECGFQNPAHFSRSFKRRFGKTPGSVKRSQGK